MFRAIISPIFRSTRLCLQLVDNTPKMLLAQQTIKKFEILSDDY